MRVLGCVCQRGAETCGSVRSKGETLADFSREAPGGASWCGRIPEEEEEEGGIFEPPGCPKTPASFRDAGAVEKHVQGYWPGTLGGSGSGSGFRGPQEVEMEEEEEDEEEEGDDDDAVPVPVAADSQPSCGVGSSF